MKSKKYETEAYSCTGCFRGVIEFLIMIGCMHLGDEGDTYLKNNEYSEYNSQSQTTITSEANRLLGVNESDDEGWEMVK